MFGESVHDRLLERLSRAGHASRALGNTSQAVPCPLACSLKAMARDEFAAFAAMVEANPATSSPPTAYMSPPTHPVRRFLEPLAGADRAFEVNAQAVLERAIKGSDTEAYAILVAAVAEESAKR